MRQLSYHQGNITFICLISLANKDTSTISFKADQEEIYFFLYSTAALLMGYDNVRLGSYFFAPDYKITTW